MKKRIFCTVLSILMVLPLCGCHDIVDFEYSIYPMFEDVGECEALKSSTLEGARFEEYDASEKDRYLKKLNYSACFAGRFTCDEFAFEIYAYEFADADGARRYFKNATGKEPDGDFEFSFVQGLGIPLFNTSLKLFDGKNAYRVYTKSWEDWESIELLLGEIFTKTVSPSEPDESPSGEEEA